MLFLKNIAIKNYLDKTVKFQGGSMTQRTKFSSHPKLILKICVCYRLVKNRNMNFIIRNSVKVLFPEEDTSSP